LTLALGAMFGVPAAVSVFTDWRKSFDERVRASATEMLEAQRPSDASAYRRAPETERRFANAEQARAAVTWATTWPLLVSQVHIAQIVLFGSLVRISGYAHALWLPFFVTAGLLLWMTRPNDRALIARFERVLGVRIAPSELVEPRVRLEPEREELDEQESMPAEPARQRERSQPIS
jgi:hypothetical protein